MSIPGSIENGSIDTEFTPILRAIDGKYCAAEAHYATQAEVTALTADTWTAIDELEARIAALEAAQPVPERELPADPKAAYAWGKHDARMEVAALQKHLDAMPDDYAHIPSAEWEAICEELESLRKFKAGVPWAAIAAAVNGAANVYAAADSDLASASAWLAANAPKGAWA